MLDTVLSDSLGLASTSSVDRVVVEQNPPMHFLCEGTVIHSSELNQSNVSELPFKKLRQQSQTSIQLSIGSR